MAILLTNDDGIDAPGLRALGVALRGLDDLYVSAPAGNRSGVGMAITLDRSLEARRHADGESGEVRYSVDGTPSDAAKFGLQHVVLGKDVRLVVSGINLGQNLGTNIRCSGTVGAAFEAVSAGIPALAVSAGYSEEMNWEGAQYYARRLAEKILSMGSCEPMVFNLNVPCLPPDAIPGLVVARHGMGGFHDSLAVEGDGGRYCFKPVWREEVPDSDCDSAAFRAGYAVVTPLRFEMTYDGMMEGLCREWVGEVERFRPGVHGKKK